jgi:hypothetical protein
MLVLLLLVPAVVGVVFFIASKTICWKEMGVTLAAVVAINLIGLGLSFAGATHDTELLNGRVTNKKQVTTSCSHSYSCRCRPVTSCSGSGKTRHCSTSTKCDTCYEHLFDYDWKVYSTVGNFTISRVDRQGTSEPPRFTKVVIGEPATDTNSYVNYIKAAPGSVLRITGQVKNFPNLLPRYPGTFDYYRSNQLVTVGVPTMPAVEEAVTNLNADLGGKKQVNFLMVVVNTTNPDYLYALSEHWLGGKKNDVILVVGVAGKDIKWSGVLTWSNVELLKVELRDAAMAAKTTDNLVSVVEKARTIINDKFRRKPMEDFKYLSYQYSPSNTVMVVLLVLGLLVSVGLSMYFLHNDPFENFKNNRTYGKYGRRW